MAAGEFPLRSAGLASFAGPAECQRESQPLDRLYNNVAGSDIPSAQIAAPAALRKKYMTVPCPDGATVDFSLLNKYCLDAAEVPESSTTLSSDTSDAVTDVFFARF